MQLFWEVLPAVATAGVGSSPAPMKPLTETADALGVFADALASALQGVGGQDGANKQSAVARVDDEEAGKAPTAEGLLPFVFPVQVLPMGDPLPVTVDGDAAVASVQAEALGPVGSRVEVLPHAEAVVYPVQLQFKRSAATGADVDAAADVAGEIATDVMVRGGDVVLPEMSAPERSDEAVSEGVRIVQDVPRRAVQAAAEHRPAAWVNAQLDASDPLSVDIPQFAEDFNWAGKLTAAEPMSIAPKMPRIELEAETPGDLEPLLAVENTAALEPPVVAEQPQPAPVPSAANNAAELRVAEVAKVDHPKLEPKVARQEVDRSEFGEEAGSPLEGETVFTAELTEVSAPKPEADRATEPLRRASALNSASAEAPVSQEAPPGAERVHHEVAVAPEQKAVSTAPVSATAQRTVESPAPAEPRSVTVVRELTEERPASPAMSFQVGERDERVHVHLNQRDGTIQVAVRSPNSEVAQSLRASVADLSGQLQEAGFRSEIVTSAAADAGAQTQSEGHESPRDGDASRWSGQQEERRRQEFEQRNGEGQQRSRRPFWEEIDE